MIYHYAGIQLRVTGTGALRTKLISMDTAREYSIQNITIPSNGREPFKLANFVEQKAQLELSTTAFEEFFSIRKIIVLIKPRATQYPG